MQYLNKIINCDCVEYLNKIDEPIADLVFADPPFNIGYKYDQYHDQVKAKNYLAWTKDWIAACAKVLKPTGALYIAIGDDYAAQVKLIAEELGLFMRNWIIWHYTFGQQTKNKFARSHTHIFYFVKDKKKFTFNDHAIRVPSGRQLQYNDKRANPKGKMPDDIWQFSRVCGTFKERKGWHPCQMPENVLKRIIAVSSNKGDLVLDPFCGSGTTAAAAFQMGRDYLTLDISDSYVKNARKRLAELKKSSPEQADLLSRWEIDELKRLLFDISLDTQDYLKNPKLLNLLVNQFSVRMNNGRKYNADDIATVLGTINT